MAVFIALPIWLCRLINGPLITLNLIINLFYAFFLILPPSGGKRKQPLTTLLGSLIFFTISYCVIEILIVFLRTFTPSSSVRTVLIRLIQHNVDYSMTTCAWLNFYFYLQIVPSKCALIRWTKANITCTIFTIIAVDGCITFSSRMVSEIARRVLWEKFDHVNETLPGNQREAIKMYDGISFIIKMSHFSVIVIVMVVSSWSTVRYLQKHIKSLHKSGTSLSSPKLRAQLRVTIIGICQGVLFSLYTLYYFFHGFSEMYTTEYTVDTWIIVTSTTIFMTCITVFLGFGQSVFRKRIINLKKAIKKLFEPVIEAS